MSVRARSRTSGQLGVAVICVAAAAAYLAIGLARDEQALAVGGPLIMLGYGAVLFALRRRSEPVSLLGGGVRDERQHQIMLRSTALTGQVLVVALVLGALTALAVGSDYAMVFCWLCALGGVTFAGATVWYSRHG